MDHLLVDHNTKCMKRSILYLSGLDWSSLGQGEGKMSMAPVWIWGGSSSPARKTALTEASVCVIVGLQEERGRGGEQGGRRMRRECRRRERGGSGEGDGDAC